MSQSRGRAAATTNTPAGLENEVEGVGVHGAAAAERDRPERGSDAQQLAQDSANRAFPEDNEAEPFER